MIFYLVGALSISALILTHGEKFMKKLIAAAVAGAFIAPAAIAATESNVTLYGSLRGFVDYVHTNESGKKNAVKLQNGNSRIGFKGADNLGNGTSIIWQVESALKQNTGSGSWANRNSFIGLEGDFGTVRVGNYDTAYALMDMDGALGQMFDQYGDSVDPKQTNGFYGRLNNRMQNSISYETRNLNGLVGRLSYGADNSAASGENSWVGTASATYTMNGLTFGAGYYHSKNHATVVDNADSASLTPAVAPVLGAKLRGMKVAVNYKFDGGLNLGAGWERAKVSGTAADSRKDSWLVGANFPMGSWLMQAAYGHADKSKGTAAPVDDKAQMALLGGQYVLSKRSSFYGYVAHVKNNQAANASIGFDSLGLKGTLGAKGTMVSLGFRTDF